MTSRGWRAARGALLVLAMCAGCSDKPKGGGNTNWDELALSSECGISCPVEGIEEGNASISGLRSVDAFFGAVVDFAGIASQVSSEMDEVSRKLAASLGLPPGTTGAEIAAAIDARVAANTDGGLRVHLVEPTCATSARVTVEATARCDVDVDLNDLEVMCMGSCEVSAATAVECDADAEVVCRGVAPALRCGGSCAGECTFGAAATCRGTCTGGCDAECSVTISGKPCGGVCEGRCSAGGTTEDGFDGTCDGTCEGTCTLPAGAAACGGSCAGECLGECLGDLGGQCSGRCEGECEYSPPSAECGAGATISCRSQANLGAMCDGRCDGDVKPPSTKAECEASASAEAALRVACTPPSVHVTYSFNAALRADAQAQAEFNAWVSGFERHIAALTTLDARAAAVLRAGAGLAAAATGAVTGAVSEIGGSGDLKAAVGGRCALDQLPKVPGVIAGASERLQASASTAARITDAL